MHIEGHKQLCKTLFHFLYTRYTGHTVGELVETPWTAEKLTGGSMRHMNDGHRHDTLDDFHGFWNWLKVQKLGELGFTVYYTNSVNSNRRNDRNLPED